MLSGCLNEALQSPPVKRLLMRATSERAGTSACCEVGEDEG